jgi:hypothetical protein
MSTLDKIIIKIIKEQELIIGPVAWHEAGKVEGLHIQNHNEIRIDGDNSTVVDKLVKQYERLFGRASREVCKEAAASLIAGLSPSEIPATLR